MAHKKGGGSSRNGRDSNAQRLGVKTFGGEYVIPGHIIVRQHGTHFHPGENVGIGKDYTIFSKIEGIVVFERMRGREGQKRISVYPEAVVAAMRGGATEVIATTDAPKPKAVKKPVVEAVVEPAAAPAPAAPKARASKKQEAEGQDKLTKIEGIGPKAQAALYAGGINTYTQLAAASPEDLYRIVKVEGKVNIVGDAATWPKQAQFLADGDLDGLKAYQDTLVGGREQK